MVISPNKWFFPHEKPATLLSLLRWVMALEAVISWPSWAGMLNGWLFISGSYILLTSYAKWWYKFISSTFHSLKLAKTFFKRSKKLKRILLRISIRYHPADRTRWREFFSQHEISSFLISKWYCSIIQMSDSVMCFHFPPWDIFSLLSSPCVVPRRLICMSCKIPAFGLSFPGQVIHSLFSIFWERFYGDWIPLFKAVGRIWQFFSPCLYLGLHHNHSFCLPFKVCW